MACSGRNRVFGWLRPTIVGCLVSACSLAPKQSPRVLETVEELPAGFAGSEAEGSYEPLEWWKAFADPALDRVIAEVLTSNFDLAEAVARGRSGPGPGPHRQGLGFPRCCSRRRASATPTRPTNAGIGAQFEELGLESGLGASGVVLPDRLGLTTYTAAAEVAYEVDFWGRNRNDALAAGAGRLASEVDYLTARMGVLAETVPDLPRDRQPAPPAEADRRDRRDPAAGGVPRRVPLRPRPRRCRQPSRGTPPSAHHAGRAAADRGPPGRCGGDGSGCFWEATATTSPGFCPIHRPPPRPSNRSRPVSRPTSWRSVPTSAPPGSGWKRPGTPSAPAVRTCCRGCRCTAPSGVQSTEAGEWFDPDQWFRNLSMNLLGPVFQGSRLRGNVALAEARLDEAAAAYGRGRGDRG